MSRAIDVGSGAGIPAIPLMIALPALEGTARPDEATLEVVALESVGKKCRFIREAARALGLGAGLRVIQARAEEAGRSPGLRDAFDLAVARGVTGLAALAELCLPFVRPGGIFVALKGPEVAFEIEGAEGAFRELGARLEASIEEGLAGRSLNLVKVRKLGPTPERYPRRTGVPAKRPLGGRGARAGPPP